MAQVCTDVEQIDALLELFQGKSRVNDGTQDHVPGRTRLTIEVADHDK